MKTKTQSIIEPLIRSNGEKHELEKQFEADEAPELKAIGYAKIVQNRQHSWVSYVLTTKGDKVLKIEISEPDMKEIAEESSKINFVNSFVDQMS